MSSTCSGQRKVPFEGLRAAGIAELLLWPCIGLTALMHNLVRCFLQIHKIMAGLLDQYTFLRNQQALQMVINEADFFHIWVEDVVAQYGIDRWISMLDVEFGGMEEVLYHLYGVTQNRNHASLAARFVKPAFYDPLVQNKDRLGGIHANTHLAQVRGTVHGRAVKGPNSMTERPS